MLIYIKDIYIALSQSILRGISRKNQNKEVHSTISTVCVRHFSYVSVRIRAIGDSLIQIADLGYFAQTAGSMSIRFPV